MPPQHPDRMVSRPRIPAAGPPPGPGAPQSVPGNMNIQQRGMPPFRIQITAPDGTMLLELSEQNGLLVARGDESRWEEGAKRFLYGMLQWSGQVGIRWKDEAIKAGEQ
jgi:hypothetical protein